MMITGLALGAALGAVMQRGRFCVTGMLRDIFLQRSWRGFTGLLIVISVHAVGLAALTSAGIIAPEYDDLAPVAVIVGGLIFGLGIVLAGGCASGTWYRSAEGLVGSWIALATYALSSAAMKSGVLRGLNEALHTHTVPLRSLPQSLGVSPWWFALALGGLTTVLACRYLAAEKSVATLHRRAWRRPLHLYAAAVIVGLLGVLAWPLSAATGRNDGLGITTPSSNVLRYLVTGDAERVDWGVMLVLGLFLGAFAAAKATGEFRVPDATAARCAVIGGLAMGVGASLAGGCTVGNGMVQTSLFTYQGWLALLFIALGVGLGARLWLRPRGAVTSVEPGKVGSMSALPSVHGLVSVGASSSASERGAVATLAPGRYRLDTFGAVCPFPLIEAKEAMNRLNAGEELVIDFDCTQATDSLPRWAAEEGHEVVDFSERGAAGWSITIRKGA
ncbi:YeeE/YedE family protein [Corynebacterium sp. zg-331]|uniref:YeeE/YedE thiosulfate transporter family protein n=1 Tax=unclassified Corynebacterium TaxID=2624378 RepID=UPI00128DB380|nr:MULTISPECIES: YeeE/YedE thiosulfate transporter family protein [unclassified Corynebacterium]MBC3185092.1 YeeE/YedE family protein [Corynebacterium sp. zg-331]MPV51591.1 YeeE/YedE family protein [Corynebacterium sp. zg331]